MEYPSNWTKSEINLKPYQVVFFYPPDVNRTGSLLESLLRPVILPVSLLIDVAPTISTNINESALRFVSFLEGNNQSRLIDHKHTTLSGLPAYEVVYYAYTNDRTSKEFDVWTLYGNDSYSLLYNAEPGYFNQYLPLAKRMIDSFQITGESGSGSADINKTKD